MKLTAMAALLLLIAGSAFADENFEKWRVGGSVVYTDYEAVYPAGRVNTGETGFKAHAQFRPNAWLGVEMAYFLGPDLKGDLKPLQAGGESDSTYKGLTLHAIGYLPSPVERMDFFLKGGYYNFDVNLKVDNVVTDSGSTDGLALGLGTAIDAADNLGIRVEFDWYDISGNVDMWTIGIGAEYRF